MVAFVTSDCHLCNKKREKTGEKIVTQSPAGGFVQLASWEDKVQSTIRHALGFLLVCLYNIFQLSSKNAVSCQGSIL